MNQWARSRQPSMLLPAAQSMAGMTGSSLVHAKPVHKHPDPPGLNDSHAVLSSTNNQQHVWTQQPAVQGTAAEEEARAAKFAALFKQYDPMQAQ